MDNVQIHIDREPRALATPTYRSVLRAWQCERLIATCSGRSWAMRKTNSSLAI